MVFGPTRDVSEPWPWVVTCHSIGGEKSWCCMLNNSRVSVSCNWAVNKVKSMSGCWAHTIKRMWVMRVRGEFQPQYQRLIQSSSSAWELGQSIIKLAGWSAISRLFFFFPRSVLPSAHNHHFIYLHGCPGESTACVSAHIPQPQWSTTGDVGWVGGGVLMHWQCVRGPIMATSLMVVRKTVPDSEPWISSSI